MKRRVPGWKTDFPIRESVEDFAGKQRTFVIDCHEGGLGYTVRASEEGKDGRGYQFASYSEIDPYSALGRVRQKMSRGLATRHITTFTKAWANACRAAGCPGRIPTVRGHFRPGAKAKVRQCLGICGGAVRI